MNQKNETPQGETARPQQLPKPTFYPFLFAFSLLFFGWGFISLWFISVAGFVGMCASLAGWINELLYEGNTGN